MSSFMNRVLGLSAALGLYDRWARRHLGQVYDTLIELADLHGNEHVLDVGSGTGILSSRFAEIADGIVVHGVDINTAMIRVAEQRVGGRPRPVRYQAATAVRLPYPSGQFDVVSSCLLFHLLQDSDKELALREIFRVLKPGGRYVCAEFETYPARLWSLKTLEYPSGLLGTVGFAVHTQFAGPAITRRRPVVHRMLRKPE